MIDSIASLFLVLTIGSIPGQLMVLFVVAFQKTRFRSIDAKTKKYLLLISYFFALTPFVFMSANKLYSLLTAKHTATPVLEGFYDAPNIANTFFRNEWVMPLAIIWFLGILYNLYRSRRNLINFQNKILLEGTQCSLAELDINDTELPAQIFSYLNNLTIIKHPMAKSPLVFGYGKRYLVIPDQMLTQRQLHMILCHEITHLEHKDLWIKLIAEIIRIIFFYNVVFILASQLLDEICEQLCDRAATSQMSTMEKKEYGHLLLSMLEKAGSGNEMTQAALSRDKRQLKNRLQAIIQPLNASRATQGFVAVIAVVVIIISLAAIAVIIPEANKWDQSRQLLSSYDIEQNSYTVLTTSTYAYPDSPTAGTSYANDQAIYPNTPTVGSTAITTSAPTVGTTAITTSPATSATTVRIPNSSILDTTPEQ